MTPDDLEGWLERELEHVRRSFAGGVVRVLRLTQDLPSGRRRVGWLVEIETSDGDNVVHAKRLTSMLRDMRLLGLQPTVLRSGPITP